MKKASIINNSSLNSTCDNKTEKKERDSTNNKNIVTRILAGCFLSYTGDPSWITGHALRRALNLRVRVSNGLFTSETSLNNVKSYGDYFKLRLRTEPLMYSEYRGFGRGRKSKYREYKPTALTFDVEGTNSTIKPGRWFGAGGMKNHGHGNFRILETMEINIEELIYPREVEWAKLVSPLAVTSIPGYFQRERLRKMEQWIYFGSTPVRIVAVDAGQVFKLSDGMDREKLREIMIRGMTRIGRRKTAGLGEYYCY